ncbi:hypothetical protein AWH56_008565 [Anaerobacillus isosaccharinicus]|uniref:Uncharacterized protein n=1 Tax=Anaerobacillus isosaccharinicus TaxID=1532552 RepID=A0A1S2L3C7_9BACI|nr:hypothetical protein [Anaerobacillus isosaccharinicus]MBA5583963.1 hypothetical protein [Anaerobacillus isosaccharinicus]QOY37618.1 hypothetical protein AWH56_008565 [Anaerobacillus isosaccharinicus]
MSNYIGMEVIVLLEDDKLVEGVIISSHKSHTDICLSNGSVVSDDQGLFRLKEDTAGLSNNQVIGFIKGEAIYYKGMEMIKF